MSGLALIPFAAASLLAAPAIAAPAPAPAQNLVILDYLEDFSAVWEQTAKLPDAERVRQLDQQSQEIHGLEAQVEAQAHQLEGLEQHLREVEGRMGQRDQTWP